MLVSTKSRFAVNALIDLALREAAGPVALASIAARQQVSLSYLEQLFSRLRRCGVVESTRGPGGGYTLGRRPERITLADVVQAVDDPMDTPLTERASEGLSQALWLRLGATMLQHMATITLHSLVQEQQALGAPVETRPVRRPFASVPAVKPLRLTAPNSVFAFGRSFA